MRPMVNILQLGNWFSLIRKSNHSYFIQLITKTIILNHTYRSITSEAFTWFEFKTSNSVGQSFTSFPPFSSKDYRVSFRFCQKTTSYKILFFLPNNTTWLQWSVRRYPQGCFCLFPCLRIIYPKRKTKKMSKVDHPHRQDLFLRFSPIRCQTQPPQSWHFTHIRDTIPSSSITTQKLPSCKTNCMDYRLCFLSFQNQTLGVCSFLFISPFRHFSKHAHGSPPPSSHLLKTKKDCLHLSLTFLNLVSSLYTAPPLSMLAQCSIGSPDSKSMDTFYQSTGNPMVESYHHVTSSVKTR